MQEYEHTQPGTLMRATLGCSAVICMGIVVLAARQRPPFRLVCSVVASILVVCVILFHSLTVKVSRDDIFLRFGIGLIRKRFAVADVQNADIVRNRWYYGWGVRLTPHGRLYNVSGFDAVELQLRNGRKYRIGTDDPVGLLSAIRSVIANTN